MKIVTVPAEILLRKAEPVTDFSSIEYLSKQMLKCMENHNGIGLAAPQIDKSIRMFVISSNGLAADGKAYINPKIISSSNEKDTDTEGCLSVPDIYVSKTRSKKILIRAQDVYGSFFEEELLGRKARIFQHENDHLDGVLITAGGNN